MLLADSIAQHMRFDVLQAPELLRMLLELRMLCCECHRDISVRFVRQLSGMFNSLQHHNLFIEHRIFRNQVPSPIANASSVMFSLRSRFQIIEAKGCPATCVSLMLLRVDWHDSVVSIEQTSLNCFH